MQRIRLLLAVAALALPLSGFAQKATAPKDEQNALVITFKDGRQRSFLMSDIARIEVNTSSAAVPTVAKVRFLGKWKVGEGNGSAFYITLEPDGVAHKTIGSSHGTWTTVDNEARISWDDGWHDAIRKVGSRYEKVAFSPGKSFTSDPDNVTKAENVDAPSL